MFVFGLILTAPGAKISHKRASLVKKGGKNAQKNDKNIHKKYDFVRKKYRNVPILDKSEMATCAFGRAGRAYFVKREAYFVGRFLAGLQIQRQYSWGGGRPLA